MKELDLLLEIQKYTGHNLYITISRVVQGPLLVKRDWDERKPTEPEEIKQFYRDCQWYIYDLTYFAISELAKRISLMKNMKEGTVLDFGAGNGDILILAHEKGYRDLTYVDLEGFTWNYAKWRFKKRKMKVNMVDIDDLHLLEDKQFDNLFALDVLEHIHSSEIPDTCRFITEHLAQDGGMFISCPPVDKYHPMHITDANYILKHMNTKMYRIHNV